MRAIFARPDPRAIVTACRGCRTPTHGHCGCTRITLGLPFSGRHLANAFAAAAPRRLQHDRVADAGAAGQCFVQAVDAGPAVGVGLSTSILLCLSSIG